MLDLETIRWGDDPTRNMALLLSYLQPSGIVPRPNKYYTFIYKAKTPGIQYDQHPLIVCGDVYKWGFNGLNQHWGEVRQYSWNEVLSNVYELSQENFQYLTNVPLAKYKTT